VVGAKGRKNRRASCDRDRDRDSKTEEQDCEENYPYRQLLEVGPA